MTKSRSVAATANDGSIPGSRLENGSITDSQINASADISTEKLEFLQSGSGALPRTVQSKLQETVSVLDFGAVGNGVTDDSAAFNAAFTSGAKRVLVPATSKYYLVKDLILPDGVNLEGVGHRRVYSAFNLSQIEGSCAMAYNPVGGTFFIRFSGNQSVSSINFHGTNLTVDCMETSSGEYLSFTDVGIFRFRRGIGKTGNYLPNSRFFNCHVQANDIGIFSCVDSGFFGVEITGNRTHGVLFGNGAHANYFVGCRNEWNSGPNWTFDRCDDVTITGGQTDRARGQYGAIIRDSRITITNHIFRRSGRDFPTNSAHIYVESNLCLALSGCIFTTGRDDDGGGNLTPNFVFRGLSPSSGPLLVTGCDVTGYTTALTDGLITATYRGNLGVADNP